MTRFSPQKKGCSPADLTAAKAYGAEACLANKTPINITATPTGGKSFFLSSSNQVPQNFLDQLNDTEQIVTVSAPKATSTPVGSSSAATAAGVSSAPATASGSVAPAATTAAKSAGLRLGESVGILGLIVGGVALLL